MKGKKGQTRKRPTGRDVLDVLASSDSPAIATDGSARVVFWNRAAERLLGRRATDVLGRHCSEALGGRDTFGNRFCSENCPVMDMARREERIHAFELLVQRSSGDEVPVHVSILNLPGSRPDQHTLVHLLEPFDPESRLARALEALGAKPTVGAPTMPAPEDGSRPPLTTREMQILESAARGLQNKEIAQELRISPATVRNHVHNILEKLEVHSKLEAVSVSFRRGWVGPGRRP